MTHAYERTLPFPVKANVMMTAHDDRGSFIAWLACLPLLHFVAFVIGITCLRNYPLEASCASLLVMVVSMLVFLWLRRDRLAADCDRGTRQVIGCCCALFAWVVLTQVLSPRQSGVARVGDTAMLVSLIMGMVLLRPDPRAWLSAVGASAACTAVAAVVLSGVNGMLLPTGAAVYGIGAAPVLGCIVTPVLAAWAIALWQRRHDTDGPRAREYILCVVGIFALAVYVVTDLRRGPVVAVGVIGLVFICQAAWRRAPRLTLLFIALASLVLATYLAPKLFSDVGTGRGERYALYRLAWTLGWEAFPFGHGPFGMLAAEDSPSHAAFMWIARERSAMHAHNELLNAWVEGGVIQVVLVLTLVGFLVMRIVRCSDRVLKMSYVALGTAWLVHALSDNTYGTPLGMAWSGVLIGGIMVLPQTLRVEVRPQARSLLWLVSVTGVIAIALGWPAFRMAWLTGTTPMHARLSAMEDCRDPVFLCSELRVITVSPDAEPQMKGIAVAIVAKRIGWTTNVPYAGVLAASAEHERVPYLESLVRLARRIPFDQNLCGSILEVVDQWPEMEELIPKRIRLRCAVFKGVIGMKPGAVVDGRDVGLAADCLITIHRSMTAGTLNEEQREQTLALARYYGQIQYVAILATQVCSMSAGPANH